MNDDVAWLLRKAAFAPDEETEARYKAIAHRLDRMEYALRSVQRTAKASASSRRKVSATWLVARAASGLSSGNP